MKQEKIELTYSTTGGISRADTLETLLVCIIQVERQLCS